LCRVLVKKVQSEPILAILREDGRERVGREVLEFIDVEPEREARSEKHEGTRP